MIPQNHRTPELEGTHQDHRVQLLGPQRTTPKKKKQSRCLTALSKQFLNSGSLPQSCDLPQRALPALGTSRSTHGAAQGATQPHASSSRPHKSLGWGGNRGGAGLPASAARFPRCPGAAQPPPPGLGCKAGGRGEGTRRSGQGSARGCSALRRRSRSSATGTGEGGGSAGPARWGCPEPGLPPVRSTPRHPLWAGEPKAARFRPEEAAGRAEPAPSGGEDSAAQLAISKRANCRAGAWAGKHKAEITRWVPGEIKGACCRSRRHTQRCHRGRCARPRASGGSGCNSPAPTALAANTAPGTPAAQRRSPPGGR